MLLKLQDKPLLVLALLVFIMLGFNLDVIPVSIMEARNFITAREMLMDDNWLLTTMNGEPRYQKPPLPSWICAMFGLAFGIKSTVALRFPALVFIVITGYFSNRITKEISKNKSQSLHTGLILVTSLYVIAIAFEAPSDIFTHGFMLIGIYQLLLMFKRNEAFVKRTLIAGFFIGCSILSKGPVSLYVLFLPFLLAYGFSFRYRFSKKLFLSLVTSIILALLIGGWWYLYVRLEDAETFTKITERETGNWTSYNVRPFYYYWSFFVQSGIWTILAFVSLLYPYLRKKVEHLKAYKFSFYWTLFSVILLSIIPEKKSRYLMPVLIPLAINTGFYLEFLIQRFKYSSTWREKIPVNLHFGLMAIISISVPVVLFFVLKEQLYNYILNYVALSIMIILLGVLLLIRLKQKNIKAAFYLNILFFAMLVALGLPLLNAFKSDNYNPPKDLLSSAESKNLEVYALGHISPEMIWEYGNKLNQLETENGLILPEEQAFGLLTDGLDSQVLKQIERQFEVEKRDIYDLNITPEGARGYNERLRTEFYILTKK